MKVVVAIDSFKGSLSSMEAGEAVRRAARRRWPKADVVVRPLADGGEGTVDALCAGLGGERVELSVCGPRGKRVKAAYCILDGKVAVLEMASAAGLPLLSLAERDPLYTTTFGVGEMIRDAIGRGCRSFIIGIGGSATNDGGAGMLSALGFAFLDPDGNPIREGAAGLADLASIKADGAMRELSDCRFRIACDVRNPLCGEEGCSAVYGPQKGATPDAVRLMDASLAHYAALTRVLFPHADPDAPGAGAAGGLGFAFSAFCGASLAPGVDIVLEEIALEEELKDADLVVTGEGRIDRQPAMGKAPIGVARLAAKHGKRVIALAGCIGEGAEVCNDCGIDAYFPILRGVTTLAEALDCRVAEENLTATAYQVFRLL